MLVTEITITVVTGLDLPEERLDEIGDDFTDAIDNLVSVFTLENQDVDIKTK